MHHSYRCSFCGEQGHNRRSCKKKIAYENRIIEKGENPAYSRMILTQRESEKNKKRAATRCSYCKGTGHNRRTCTVLSSDKKIVMADLKLYRERFLAAVQEKGIGPGALVKYPFRSWTHKGGSVVGLIAGIDWSSVNQKWSLMDLKDYRARTGDTFLKIRVLKSDVPEGVGGWHGPPKPGSLKVMSAVECLSLLTEVMENTEREKDYPAAEVLSRAPSVSPPKDFLEPESLPIDLQRTYGFERVNGISSQKLSRLDVNTSHTRKLFQSLEPEVYAERWSGKEDF